MQIRLTIITAVAMLQGCASAPQPETSTLASPRVPAISAKQAFLAETPRPEDKLAGEKGLVFVKQADTSVKPHKTPADANLVLHYQGLTYWIERSTGSGFQRVTAATEFFQGDQIRFHLRANRSGYLYMVTRGVSGRTSYLYPSKPNESEYIEAGKDYLVPRQGAIVFDNQSGTEDVWLFLSDKPLSAGNDETSPGAGTPSIAANSCSSKDLLLNAPDAALGQCGPGGNSKDILVEDDSHSEQPGGYGVMNSEQFDKGALLSLKLQLRHK